jgi:transcriptional regulator with XRE-family HTH domain
MDDEEITALIAALRAIIAQESLSLKGLAYRLGFSTGHLSMILARQRRPGLRFVRAVMERYPEVGTRLLRQKGEGSPFERHTE